jgi:hypothetical protein
MIYNGYVLYYILNQQGGCPHPPVNHDGGDDVGIVPYMKRGGGTLTKVLQYASS